MKPAVPILSDLDGTLIDSSASVVAAFRWWAKRRGLPLDTAERIPFGRTSADAAAALAPWLDAAVEGALLDDRQAADTRGVVAYAGARELLEQTRTLAIVTSCPDCLARARLQAAGLPAPHLLVTPERYRRGKPDPEPYALGAELLGAVRTDCVVLEDSPAGLESGLRAGMRVIALLTTHSRDQLPGAAAYLRTLSELPALLRSWSAARPLRAGAAG